jgi:hypothetical protein
MSSAVVPPTVHTAVVVQFVIVFWSGSANSCRLPVLTVNVNAVGPPLNVPLWLKVA